MARLELAEVLTELREQLRQSLEQAQDQRVRFDLGTIELKLSMTATREATPGAKVRFWVIEAGTELTFAREAVQEITLTLIPHDSTIPRNPEGRPSTFTITGAPMPGER